MIFMEELKCSLQFRYFILISIVFVCACSKEKSADTVFPRSKTTPTCGAQSMGTRFIVEWEDGRFSVERDRNADAFREGFVSDNLNEIRNVSEDFYFRRQSSKAQMRGVQSDAERSMERADFAATDLNYDWGQELVGANALWDAGYKGLGVKVGVVDSFVDISHDSLNSQTITNPQEIPDNGIDDDNNGWIDDYRGKSFISVAAESKYKSKHGTHVAGIIAGAHSHGDVHGIAPEATLIPAPFINDDDVGSYGDAIMALQFVASQGAKVVNLSWGGPACILQLRSVLSDLGKLDVMIVVAAGNGGGSAEQNDLAVNPLYPAAFNLDNQLTVAATSSYDLLMSWSFYNSSLVHLAAPGNYVWSSVPGNAYSEMSGTSMAAPFVAGAAALLWSAYPQATLQQIKQAIMGGVTVPHYALPVASQGRLNVKNSFELLKKQFSQP